VVSTPALAARRPDNVQPGAKFMSLQIHPINLGHVTVDASGLVLMRSPGTSVSIPVLGYLITGGSEPIPVDTGARSVEHFQSLGFPFTATHEETIDFHLAGHGLKRTDIRHIIHTHAHVDHAGGDYLFPMSTQVVMARRELEFMASGIMGPLMYTGLDTKHLIDRLYERGALRLVDVDGTYEEEIIPGVAVQLSGGHTPGSLSILVETEGGMANICGDIIYDFTDQIVVPFDENRVSEPTIAGNRAMTTLEEKRAMKRALAKSRFLFPGHDTPALVERGKIIGLAKNAISNPNVDALNIVNYESVLPDAKNGRTT